MPKLSAALLAAALVSIPAVASADIGPEPDPPKKNDDKDCSIGGPQDGVLAFGFVVLLIAGVRLRGREG